MVKSTESLLVHEIKSNTTNELKIIVLIIIFFSFEQLYIKKIPAKRWDLIFNVFLSKNYSTSILIGRVYLTPTAFPLCLPGFIFGSNLIIRIASF